jgi:uncharacterized membrane protein YfcA
MLFTSLTRGEVKAKSGANAFYSPTRGEVKINQEPKMFFIYLLIGACSGTLAGLLGLGGGIIVVPALAAAFAYNNLIPPSSTMHMAVGTSLATITITFLSSLSAHLKKHSVRWDIVKKLLPGLIVGVILGALIANHLPSTFLRLFFSAFLLFVASRLFFGELAIPTATLPGQPALFGITCVIGALSSILGAGGGIVLIPFMVRAQINMREATGTSVACGVVIGFVATLSFITLGTGAIHNLPWSTGFIYWPAFLGVAMTSVLFAPLGTAIAYRLPIITLKRILAVFIVLVAIQMLLPVLHKMLG